MNHPPFVIGVAGGTGSGKTTVANAILRRVGDEGMSVLFHDAYYRDWADLPKDVLDRKNFDHPDSLETELLVRHVRALREGQVVEAPIYDFVTHRRTAETRRVLPKRIVLVEGILIFAEPALRTLFDVKVFVDTDADVRLIRRIRRDIAERGRTLESVVEQYYATVRPMHLEFVEPSKRWADLIVPEGGENAVAMEFLFARLERLLAP
ncbi:MAG TPA: uridine kinase [Thermoanaerobaculia bacterium]|nr:uridine kinase [Thermoanaerobaculia bacterium]HQR67288.1 uridine kinase [Thermoanaerobaculia bacterium]